MDTVGQGEMIFQPVRPVYGRSDNISANNTSLLELYIFKLT